MLPVENEEMEVVAIQRIYLDPVTGKKAFKKKGKITNGTLKGHAAIIHRGKIGKSKIRSNLTDLSGNTSNGHQHFQMGQK